LGTQYLVDVEFEPWYRAEYPRLVNTLAIVTGDRTLAVDAAADAFVKALGRWHKVGAMDRPGGWVYKVALNEARRRAKRQAKERKVVAAGHVNGLGSTTEVMQPPLHGDIDLWDAVGRLGERTKTVVVLRYVADLTEPEIAKTLGITRGSVATMLRRAHARLADELGPSSVQTTQEYSDVAC
jgi:RNA polymerase sigma-70 factor (ECF subfamily)